MVQLSTLLVVCLVATLTAPAEAVFSNTLMQLVRPKLRQCAKDNSVTDAELERIIANDLTNQSPAIQCTSLCFFKKLYMFREDGSINVPASIALFSFGERPCFVAKVVNKCKDLVGTDECNTASLIYACYVQNKLL